MGFRKHVQYKPEKWKPGLEHLYPIKRGSTLALGPETRNIRLELQALSPSALHHQEDANPDPKPSPTPTRGRARKLFLGVWARELLHLLQKNCRQMGGALRPAGRWAFGNKTLGMPSEPRLPAELERPTVLSLVRLVYAPYAKPTP